MPQPRPARLVWTISAVALVSVGVALGPKVRFDEAWMERELPGDLDAWLAASEAPVPGIRAGDQKEILWADPAERIRTPVAVVYLHGFSADRHEIEPVLSGLARELGFNAYFSRLRGHGRDGAAMAEATVEDWLEDTAEAVAIGERIGERVVVIGTSTGGTLATWAAARAEGRERIDGLVLLSPNFQPKDRSSRVLLFPWGSVIAEAAIGPERCFAPENERQERHWTTCYPTAALATMMALVEHVRVMDLEPIRATTLVLYHPDDQVVEFEETRRAVAGMTGTTPRLREVRSTSDPARHVLAGDIVSPASNDEVAGMLRAFLVGVAR